MIWDIMGNADTLEKGMNKHRGVWISIRRLSALSLHLPEFYHGSNPP